MQGRSRRRKKGREEEKMKEKWRDSVGKPFAKRLASNSRSVKVEIGKKVDVDRKR